MKKSEKIIHIFLLLLRLELLIFCLAISNFYTKQTNKNTGTIFIILAILLICSIVFSLLKSAAQKKVRKKDLLFQEQKQILHAEVKAQKLSAIDTLSLPPIVSPRLFLKKDEVAYIEQPATLTITENKVVGTTGRSSGVSMRVAKGMYVRTGGSGGRKIYDDITTTYDGILSVTNQRISFMQERKAFEIQLSKLTNTTSDDKTLILQQGNKSYALLTDDADIIECLIRRLCRN